jgi:hypothetical protein
MSDIEPRKPWSVDQFEFYRPAICAFVKTKVVVLLDDPDDTTRRILIRGDVKVGKREMVEYIALRDFSSAPRRVHAFISAFHRSADEMQRDELAGHQLKVFSLSTRTDVTPIIDWVRAQIANGLDVVLHYDEADYGSGSRQRLNQIWGRFRENEHVKSILYSATPEELLYSECISQTDDDDDFAAEIYRSGIMLHYVPSAGYCGAKRFLDENLVFNATRFFHTLDDGRVVLSTQAREILRDAQAQLEECLDAKAEARLASRRAERAGNEDEANRQKKIAARPARNVITLRLSYGVPGVGRARIERKAIYTFLQHVDSIPELATVDVRVDKEDMPEGAATPGLRVTKDTIRWSDPAYWDGLTSERLILVVMDQTSTRSTEWAFHNRVFATHEYRLNVTYCVCAQAQLRVAHYERRYGGFQPIRVYGHKKTFEFAAERIGVDDYINNEWTLRTLGRQSVQVEVVDRHRHRHPAFPTPMTEEEGMRVLEDLGCDVSVKISDRVRGKTKRVPEVLHHFEPCTTDTVSGAFSRFKRLMQDQRSLLPPNTPPAVHQRLMANEQHAFNNPFRDELLSEDGLWMCPFRGEREVREYPYFFENRWGFSWTNMAPRTGLCYRGDELGLAFRYTTGREIVIDTLESYKSMYQPPRH